MKTIKPYVYTNWYGIDIYRSRGTKNTYYFALTSTGKVPVHEKFKTCQKAISYVKKKIKRKEQSLFKKEYRKQNQTQILSINERIVALRKELSELIQKRKSLQ